MAGYLLLYVLFVLAHLPRFHSLPDGTLGSLLCVDSSRKSCCSPLSKSLNLGRRVKDEGADFNPAAWR